MIIKERSYLIDEYKGRISHNIHTSGHRNEISKNRDKQSLQMEGKKKNWKKKEEKR